jgi:cellulose synthase (UDP-forming)
LEEAISLQGQITSTGFDGEFPTVQIILSSSPLLTTKLVEMLFCRPGQWKRHQTPGELKSLWLLLKILLKPQVLFGRNAKISAMLFLRFNQLNN